MHFNTIIEAFEVEECHCHPLEKSYSALLMRGKMYRYFLDLLAFMIVWISTASLPVAAFAGPPFKTDDPEPV